MVQARMNRVKNSLVQAEANERQNSARKFHESYRPYQTNTRQPRQQNLEFTGFGSSASCGTGYWGRNSSRAGAFPDDGTSGQICASATGVSRRPANADGFHNLRRFFHHHGPTRTASPHAGFCGTAAVKHLPADLLFSLRIVDKQGVSGASESATPGCWSNPYWIRLSRGRQPLRLKGGKAHTIPPSRTRCPTLSAGLLPARLKAAGPLLHTFKVVCHMGTA